MQRLGLVFVWLGSLSLLELGQAQRPAPGIAWMLCGHYWQHSAGKSPFALRDQQSSDSRRSGGEVHPLILIRSC
jgi:hypothetical protein